MWHRPWRLCSLSRASRGKVIQPYHESRPYLPLNAASEKICAFERILNADQQTPCHRLSIFEHQPRCSIFVFEHRAQMLSAIPVLEDSGLNGVEAACDLG